METPDNMIAAMVANHPRLTRAKSFYVEISRARDRTELSPARRALRERLEAVTGERISALEGIGEAVRPERGLDKNAVPDRERPGPGATAPSPPERELDREPPRGKAPEPEPPAPGERIDMDLSL